MSKSSSTARERAPGTRMPARPALPYNTSESPSDVGEYAASAPTASNTFPGASGNVDDGSCSRCGGCRVKYSLSNESSAAYITT